VKGQRVDEAGRSLRSRRWAAAVGAYVLLGGGLLAWTLVRTPTPVLVTVAALWSLATLGLVLRKRLALVVLLLFELLALVAWIVEPEGDWRVFPLQVVLVFLLLSPAMDEWVRPLPPARAGPAGSESGLVGLAFVLGLTVWGVVEAVTGDLRAIPLFALAALLAYAVRQVRSHQAASAAASTATGSGYSSGGSGLP
jgi:hypothetical protein